MRDDPDPIDQAYREHRRYVRGCLGRAGLPASALDDAVHDVFAVLVRRRADLDPRWSVRQWLAGIARHVAANHRRRARRPDPSTLAAWSSASTPGTVELRLDLTRELALLEARELDAVLMCDRDGRSAAETAAALGLPLTTVQWRLRCAHRRLRALLERQRGMLAGFFAFAQRRLGLRAMHGGITAGFAMIAITGGWAAPADLPSHVVLDHRVADAPHGASAITAGPVAAPRPTLAIEHRSAQVILGTPRVEPQPQLAAPDPPIRARPELRPRRRNPTRTGVPRPIVWPDGIHFVMEDLQVPSRDPQ